MKYHIQKNDSNNLEISQQKSQRTEDSGTFSLNCSKKLKCQPRILQVAKIPFRNDVEINVFSDQGKLTAFVAKRPDLEEKLKEVLKAEKK